MGQLRRKSLWAGLWGWGALGVGGITASLAASAGEGALAVDGQLCRLGSGASCTASELADPVRYPQVVVFPAGFGVGERAAYESAFHALVDGMSQSGSDVYAQRYLQRMIYRSVWIPGGALGSSTSNFGAAIIQHPVRSTALSLRQDEVIETVESPLLGMHPSAVMVVFNSHDGGVTANASPPTFLGKTYGIAKVTLDDIESQYVPVHELAHAMLNFVDEYIEGGFESVAVQSFDAATSLVLFNGSLTGFRQGWRTILQIYDLRLSEVLAANGSENIDTSRIPSRVETEGYKPEVFENQGGMFFGKGTWHDEGKSLMGGFSAPGQNDGFGYHHTESQEKIISEFFDHRGHAPRPNDRIAAAGPRSNWPSAMGKEASLLLFDADKNHAFHPTLSYEVQVGFEDVKWGKCTGFWGGQYPCLKKEWVTLQKEFQPVRSTVSIESSRAFGIIRGLQSIVCFFGVKQLGPLSLCGLTLSQMSKAFLPTLEFPLPYQEISVPVPQAMTRYSWRFRTRNSAYTSGWTGWSSFVRTF